MSGPSSAHAVSSDRAQFLPYRLAPTLLASALAAYAITWNRGAYAEPAVLCVVTGLLVLTFAFASALRAEPRAAGDPKLVVGLVWIALFSFLWAAVSDPAIVIYAQRPWDLGRMAQRLGVALLVSYLPWLVSRIPEPAWVGHLRFAGFVVVVALAGVDTIHSSPAPRIDVWGIQMQGAEALLGGKNPYLNVAVHDTGPGTLQDSVPYVYPPTQVYVTIPGFLLGDVRYSMLGAILLVGIVLRSLSPTFQTALARDAAALFLYLSPKLFFIVEQAWIDPIQLLFITVALACASRNRWLAAAVVMGIACSSKQTMFWLFPLTGFCLRFKLREWVAMAVAGALPVLPFVMWDWRALKYANFDVLNELPSRSDSLTINNWATNNLHVTVPGGAGFALAGLVVVLACWKLRGAAALALAIAMTYFVFFSWNRWAFANYYFLVAGLCAASAAAAHGQIVPKLSAFAHPRRTT